MTPVLAAEGLVKNFGALRVTDDVSLDLQPGECHALIGPNGAGKTTLIHQLSGLMRPDAGTIRFAGRDVTALDLPARARVGLGRTFQISAVAPSFSALENVALAAQATDGSSFRFLRPAAAERALNDRAAAALEGFGLGARMATPAGVLSHGERRLLELAMTWVQRPKALLLDEPMAGLGQAESRTLTATLERLRRETPMLLVEHDMEAVFALADRVSVLVYGRLIATGAPDAIRADPAVRAAYLGEDA